MASWSGVLCEQGTCCCACSCTQFVMRRASRMLAVPGLILLPCQQSAHKEEFLPPGDPLGGGTILPYPDEAQRRGSTPTTFHFSRSSGHDCFAPTLGGFGSGRGGKNCCTLIVTSSRSTLSTRRVSARWNSSKAIYGCACRAAQRTTASIPHDATYRHAPHKRRCRGNVCASRRDWASLAVWGATRLRSDRTH